MGRPEKVPDDEASIGAQRRRARRSRGISLTAIAALVFRNKGYLSSVERGRLPGASRAAEMQWLEQQKDPIFAQYAGLWIGVVGEAVVARGRTPAEVLSAARAIGQAEPFVAFIPAEPIKHVHLCQTFTIP